MSFLIQQTLLFAIPLMIVALAGVFSERSGVINLALEGIMIMGAFIGVLAVRILQSTPAFQEASQHAMRYISIVTEAGRMHLSAAQEQAHIAAEVAKGIEIGGQTVALNTNAWVTLQGMQLLCVLIAGAAGAIFSLLLSYAAINLRSDQTIGGTALNLLAPAISLFLIRILVNQNTMGMKDAASSANWFQLKQIYFGYGFSDKPGFFVSTFLDKTYVATFLCIIIVIVMSIILYKTRFGLRLRSCGENPQAAASLGINVYKMRYAGVTISGFLALAVMIFGNWKPLNIAGASLLFGLLKCIAASYSTLDINGDGKFLLTQIGISSYVYRLLPYVITLVVLALTSKSSRAPKAEGIPYDKGMR